MLNNQRKHVKATPNNSRPTEKQRIPPFGLGSTLLVFGGGGLLLLLSTRVLIPYFSETTGIEPVIFWFITVSLLVFLLPIPRAPVTG